MDGNSSENCSADALADFSKSVGRQMLRVNALLVVNTILMGVMVGIGAYGHRFRHHPLTRFLFLGATTLFLPIISYVVSTIGNQYIIGVLSSEKIIITGRCSPRGHVFLVLVWTGLVQIVGISTTTIVAVDPREGRNIAPPMVLLVQAIWTSYLAIYTAGGGGQEGFDLPEFGGNLQSARGLILLLVFALIFTKTFFKYYAFYEAGRSFALGSNPRFIVGYMEMLRDTGRSQHVDPLLAPHIVMGEDVIHRKKEPHGYSIRWMSESDQAGMNSDGLVTMDKVWQQPDDSDAMHLLAGTIPQLKDLCFSFALFKLLRCRFARYKIVEVDLMNACDFFWHVLPEANSDERVFALVGDELSFLHDCYYSSHPISYSKPWLPILDIFISLLSIGYCFFVVTGRTLVAVPKNIWQIRCEVKCGSNASHFPNFGSLLFDLVPVCVLIAIVVLAEARDITCYICSDWTKVAIYCRYINQASWQDSPTIQKWVGGLLQCRCKLVKPWVDRMNQCSILVPLPRKTPMVLLRHLLRLPEEQKNDVKVPRVVKAAIIDKLRSKKNLHGRAISLPSSVDAGNCLLWERNGDGIAETLLVWHIATSIFEARQPQSPAVAHDEVTATPPCTPIDAETGGDNFISKKNDTDTATKLSRYCAYLVIYSPELLPDNDECCKALYKAVKKDAVRALAGRQLVSSFPAEKEFLDLVDLLGEDSNHKVLKKGVELEKRLARLSQAEAWKVMADFWVEMILYVAPSDHLDVQAEAVARGGEMITLLWALLTHLGVDTRDETSTVNAPGHV